MSWNRPQRLTSRQRMYWKSFRLPDPVLHHVLEAWPTFGGQPGLAGVQEFVDNLHAVFLCPFSHLILLNLDRILLTILCGMAVVCDCAKRELGFLNAFVWTFPPVFHVFLSC